jgi:hypothetical protein
MREWWAAGRSETSGGRGGFLMAGGEAPSARIHGGAGVAAWPSGSARRLENPRRNESDDRQRSRRHKIG